MITPLSEAETREVLKRGRIGRLGCIAEDEPYVVPICYLFEGDSIYVHSFKGRKVTALRQNPRACLQTDEIIDDYHWTSAIAFGRFEEVTDAEVRAWVVRRFLTHFPNLTPVEAVPVHDGASSVVIFRIRVERLTGVVESP
jgi:nitroimidazol reductase NimA-like FMN-containing flavoprotein (pyridoxamine 5'-phosphate oxidase superfamily)